MMILQETREDWERIYQSTGDGVERVQHLV